MALTPAGTYSQKFCNSLLILSIAEKLQVISTPRAVFVREVVNTFLREDGALGPDSLNWNTNRGSDFRCLGHAIHIMEHSSSKKSILSDFSHVEKWLQAKDSVDKAFKEDVMESLRIFARLVSDSKYGKIFKKYKKVSPVEFVYTAVFIYKNKNSTSISQLAVGVEEMFDHVRTIYMDVRMNNRVQKTFNAFVDEWQAQKGIGDVSDTAGQKRKRNTATTKKKKNGKADENMDVDEGSQEDGEDEDYEVPKAKKRSPPGKFLASKALSTTSTPVTTQQKTPTLIQVKTEPANSNTVVSAPPKPTLAVPKPPVDRLAALRKTKETIAQNQAQAAQNSTTASPLPVPSRTDGTPSTSTQASLVSANPQMLRSPAQGFIIPPSVSAATPLANPASSFTNSSPGYADQLSWQNQGQNVNPNGSPSGQRIPGLPPLPLSAPPYSTGNVSGFGERDRDRERDRDWERNREWERRGFYDERDRDSYRRYDHHRRDSGGFGGGSARQRSPDDRRTSSGRWR